MAVWTKGAVPPRRDGLTSVLTILGGAVAVALAAYLAVVWLVVAALGVAVAAALWIHRIATGATVRPTPSVASLSESGARFAKVDLGSGEHRDSGVRDLVHQLSDSQLRRTGRTAPPQPIDSLRDTAPPRKAEPLRAPEPTPPDLNGDRPTRELPRMEPEEPERRGGVPAQVTRIDSGEVPAAISRSRMVHQRGDD